MQYCARVPVKGVDGEAFTVVLELVGQAGEFSQGLIGTVFVPQISAADEIQYRN